MSDDYLWDGSGEPDPAVQKLEKLLGEARYRPPATGHGPRAMRPRRANQGSEPVRQLRVGHIETDYHNVSLHERSNIAHSEMLK